MRPYHYAVLVYFLATCSFAAFLVYALYKIGGV